MSAMIQRDTKRPSKWTGVAAEREGFEPSVRFKAAHSLSRRAPSATRSPPRGPAVYQKHQRFSAGNAKGRTFECREQTCVWAHGGAVRIQSSPSETLFLQIQSEINLRLQEKKNSFTFACPGQSASIPFQSDIPRLRGRCSRAEKTLENGIGTHFVFLGFANPCGVKRYSFW